MKTYQYFVFPSLITEVVCDDYDRIRDDLISWIYDYQSRNPEGAIASNRGGWQSVSSEPIEEDAFLYFKDYIALHASKVLNEIYPNQEFHLGNMWVNINRKGDYNVTHAHPMSSISGVFWVKTSENCGSLKFHNPHTFGQYELICTMDDEMKKKSNFYELFGFPPQEGRLVLFPSELLHHVDVNESDEDRISISFNLRMNYC